MSLRPPILDPFFAPLTSLSGIGTKIAPLLDRLLSASGHPARVIDLLFHIPRSSLARKKYDSILDAPVGIPVTIGGWIKIHKPSPPAKGRAPYRIILEDETADLALVFFHGSKAHLEKTLPIGEKRYVSGTIELWNGFRQITHPERITTEAELDNLPDVEVIYPQTEGISSRMLSKYMAHALQKIPDLPEWQNKSWIDKQKWPGFSSSLFQLHQPDIVFSEETQIKNPARRRLVFDEFLASQLALALARSKIRRQNGRPAIGTGIISDRIESALPFVLTDSQKKALSEIRKDLASDHKMLRLLQGDVGSGKTIIALLSMITVIESGRQAALMVPTEILARQHYERIVKILDNTGVTAGILTGREKLSERRSFLKGVENGSIHLAIGTHALFQENVIYHDLGLAIVDEQHRFGVHQRLALGSKGLSTDVLVMTATPIPRTLSMTMFGDMDVSVLSEKPAGRKPVATRLIAQERISEVIAALKRAVAQGDLVYWICPLVAESEILDLAAAEERFEDLRQYFGDNVGLVHGKMSGEEKDAAMERFISGQTKILVSTTVIEVGVDVRDAAVMVIEHAERFGLAQLHQLRGRIGRGERSSACLLLYKGPLSETARARLEIMRETEDGFRIAEEDLRLRGEGEVLGARQSGLPGMKIASLEHDKALLAAAHDDARMIIESDPDLLSERGQALRLLLYLFDRDQAIRLLQAG